MPAGGTYLRRQLPAHRQPNAPSLTDAPAGRAPRLRSVMSTVGLPASTNGHRCGYGACAHQVAKTVPANRHPDTATFRAGDSATITVDGVQLAPAAGLATLAARTPHPSRARPTPATSCTTPKPLASPPSYDRTAGSTGRSTGMGPGAHSTSAPVRPMAESGL
mgnify:FL=1